jgi:exonuclease SbcC
MKLRRLSIESLPGIDRPFELEDPGDGLNIIYGPNGIGKSRLCTAVRALLWHERGISRDALMARADFAHEGTRWQVVREGSLHRWQRDGIDASPPPLPGEHLDGCFFLGLRDLLDGSDRSGLNLAGRIRRQMSGGFDLDTVKLGFKNSVPARVGSKESKACTDAEKEIGRAKGRQDEIESARRQLGSLESRAAEAEGALHRLAHFTTAISMQGLRGDLEQRRRALSELPESLAQLDGKEIARLDKLDEDLVQKRGERESAANALDDSREAVRNTRLDGPIDSASLATWRERAEGLADLERELEAARLLATGARAAVLQCRRSLGAEAPPELDSVSEPELAIGDDFDLFGFLRDSHQLTSETEVVRERIRLLAPREFSDEDSRRLELLRRGVEPLRAWLRAPDPGLQASAMKLWPSARVYLGVGATLVGIGLALQFLALLMPYPLLALGAGIGFVVVGLVSRTSGETRTATDWHSIAREQFPTSIDPPRGWSIDAVTERLRQLEDELAKYDSSEKRARDRSVERLQLEESLNGFEPRRTDLASRRSDLAARLGLENLRPDAEIVGLARALDALRTTQREAQSVSAKVDELEARRREALKSFASHLIGLGEVEPSDAASARAGMHSLEGRARDLHSASAEAIREEKSRDRLDREIERLEMERSEIFEVARLEANDRPGLTRLLNDLGRYHELNIECSNLSSAIERAASDLDVAGEGALAEWSVSQLEEGHAVQKRKADDRKDLDRKIAEIRVDARNAREGHVLEDAIAKKVAAMRQLHERRDEALAALAGQLLIDSVRHDHEANQMPRVLERARDRFATFTHHRYELTVSPSDGGSFVAVDTRNDEGLSPDQLSDGTRAQLILAARLAFAEEAEQGADLPLFLDEAMDHSDPERFHAIARSLARMVADEGRQIFYLTNDPTDIERFRSAFGEEECDQLKTFDLAQVRGHALRIDQRDALRVAPLGVVPSPSEAGFDADPESYGVTLGVPPLDPSHDDPLDQHIYYLLRDDLLLLHELMQARIESVGQCRSLLRGGSSFAKSVVEGSEIGASLEARIELLEIFCHTWREGRGAKVARVEIEESGAVSEKYLEAVVEVARELGGDASLLVAALKERKDSRLAGYRKKSALELEEFFIDRGYIDDKEIPTEKDAVDRAIGTPAANQLSPKIAAELVHQWWTFSNHSKSSE